MHTDRVSAWGALSTTVTHSTTFLFGYVTYYTYGITARYNRFNCRTASMRCSVSHNPMLKWIVDVTMWQTNFYDNQRCWWHRVFLRRRTVVDRTMLADRHKFSAVKHRVPVGLRRSGCRCRHSATPAFRQPSTACSSSLPAQHLRSSGFFSCRPTVWHMWIKRKKKENRQ